MLTRLENPFYYLENFHQVIEWIAGRYQDLLLENEKQFLRQFVTLPHASRALLVRMIMRKGELFRHNALHYDEIGQLAAAMPVLLEQGWVNDSPTLTLDQLFQLLSKSELSDRFPLLKSSGVRKGDALAALRCDHSSALPLQQWLPDSNDIIYQLLIREQCELLRLLFFGNLHQDWSEFVLTDLGRLRYEQVKLDDASRGFSSRTDVDLWLQLYRARERLHLGDCTIHNDLPTGPLPNPWLEGRRCKLLFELARQLERNGDLTGAVRIYADCTYPGARARCIRAMELDGQWQAAFDLAMHASAQPENEAEIQKLQRMLPRLSRHLGLPRRLIVVKPEPLTAFTLVLPASPASVELCVRNHLDSIESPAFYVENCLINALFGLLCWDAIFLPLPGAFFHPFHAGPADLYRPDFRMRREMQFAACLAQLESGQYRQTIKDNYRQKMDLQSPFLAWAIVSETLLDLALSCIPASHLRLFFDYMLQDLSANRSGFPDLIQFWPVQARYQMIEVKGPGDRLQDNQQRWLAWCQLHELPVAVCHVRWQEAGQ